MNPTDELLAFILAGTPPSFSDEFEEWVRGSRRFKAFADEYRTKIRAKVKTATGESAIKDLRAELEAAILLLREERFTVKYETYAASKQRGPDFTVTYKTHTPFNVEVRRIRSVEREQNDDSANVTKLMAVLCEKVGQMPPGIVNVLWLTGEGSVSQEELQTGVVTLQKMAELPAHDFFMRRGFRSAGDFSKQVQRLSGIVLRSALSNPVWQNKNARHPLPRAIMTSLERLLHS